MTAFGYFLSCEEFTPAQVLDGYPMAPGPCAQTGGGWSGWSRRAS